MFTIQSGIPKPAEKSLGGTSFKYPLDELAVGQFFVVPKSQMLEGDTPTKFRGRINQAVRTYKQRANSKAHLEPDYDEAAFTPLDFTVLTLGKPPAGHEGAWEPGDVGVWRDA